MYDNKNDRFMLDLDYDQSPLLDFTEKYDGLFNPNILK